MGKFYLIGLGLSADLITLRALKVVKSVKKVFIDTYTNILLNRDELQSILGRDDIIQLSRYDIENMSARKIIEALKEGDVALLVPGDPLVATTHTSVLIEVAKRGFKFEVIPGVSIVPNALTLPGLMIYKLGKIATVVYPREGIVSEYPYNVIKDNDKRNLHTLLLLDLDAEKGVFMKVNEAVKILYEIERRRHEGVIRDDRLGVAIAALGSPTQVICVKPLCELSNLSISEVPQTLIITSPKLHFMEEEMLKVINREYCRR